MFDLCAVEHEETGKYCNFLFQYGDTLYSGTSL